MLDNRVCNSGYELRNCIFTPAVGAMAKF